MAEWRETGLPLRDANQGFMKDPPAEHGWHLLSTAGGSLVVCVVTPAAVYLSADSRYAGAPGALRDSARKLLACGSTAICGLSGLVRFTRTEYARRGDDVTSQTTFELSDIVDGLDFEKAPGEEPGLAQAFAERLHRALVPVWERFAILLDEPFGSTRADPMAESPLRLAQLFYVNREGSGRAFLSTIDLKHTVHVSASGHYSSVLEVPVIRPVLHGPVRETRIYVRGKRSCARPELFPDSVDADADALRIIEGVFEDAQRGARCAAAIGGPVDVAVIDGAGRRWLRQKPECRISTGQNHCLEESKPNGPK